MELDDFFESPVIAAVATTAVVLSPRARRVLRRGAVYGVAGVLMAGDQASSFIRGVGRGVQEAAATAGADSENGTESGRAESRQNGSEEQQQSED